jgi:hypothetical protein
MNVAIGINLQDWIQWRSNDSYSNSFHWCSVSDHHLSPSVQSASQIFSKLSSVEWMFLDCILGLDWEF